MSATCKKLGVALKRAATRYDTVQLTRLPNEPLLSALLWCLRFVILVQCTVEIFLHHRYVEYASVSGDASVFFTGNPLASQGGKLLTDLTESEVPGYCRDSMRHELYYPYKCQQKMMQMCYNRTISDDPDVFTDDEYNKLCKLLFAYDPGKTFSEHLGCQDFDFINHVGTTATGGWVSLQELMVPFECEDGSFSPIDASLHAQNPESRVMGCAKNPKTNFSNLRPKQLELFKQRTTLNVLGVQDVHMLLRFSYNTTGCLDQDAGSLMPSAMCNQGSYQKPWIKLHRRRRPNDTKSRAPLIHRDYDNSTFTPYQRLALNSSGHRVLTGISIKEWLDYAGIDTENTPKNVKNATVFENENEQDWLVGIFGDRTINHPSYRQTGLKIKIYLVYSNFRPEIDRHSGLQSRPQIDIYVEPEKSHWVTFKRARVMWNADRRSGVTVTNSAVEFNVEISGEMGSFSIFAVISFITSAAVLLQIARVIVDLLAEYVLPDKQAFKRVRYGDVRARLKDISKAIRIKSQHNRDSESQSGKLSQVYPSQTRGLSVSTREGSVSCARRPMYRVDTVKDLAFQLSNCTATKTENKKANSKDNTTKYDATGRSSGSVSDVDSSSDEKVLVVQKYNSTVPDS